MHDVRACAMKFIQVVYGMIHNKLKFLKYEINCPLLFRNRNRT